MQAVILAAGMGKRLGELTSHNTKCMVSVNGATLIERMLHQIAARRFDRVVMVVGYEGEKLKDYVGTLQIGIPIVFVENSIYDCTNNIYSLYLAKEYLTEQETILFESDLIFEDSVLDKLLAAGYPNLALVAKFESWMDGTVVILDKEDYIKKFISPEQFSFEEIPHYYKTVNIYKLSKDFSASYYVPFLEAYCKALGRNEYYEQVLRVITLLDRPELKVLRLTDDAWYEIDDVQDLDIAASIFADKEQRLQKVSQRYGGYWRYPLLLDFCYLVNPYFPNAKLLAELKSNFERLIGAYPSGMQVNSLLAAKNWGVKPHYCVVGNGAAELIKSVMEKLSGIVGAISPSFEEYANRYDSRQMEVFIPGNPGFTYTAKDLISYFDSKDIAALLLVNPDNPSGSYIPHKDIIELCQWTQQKGIRFIVDESFVDFAEDDTGSTLIENSTLEQFDNLLVIKSISKSYGVPGLRLGILASSNAQLVAQVKKDVAIWNINSFAEFYMQIYGKYERHYKAACRQFREVRNDFFAQLQQISWLQVFPSQASYFLCKVTDKYTSQELAQQLLEKNILIKDCAAKKGFSNASYIRIAVRSSEDNAKLLDCLKLL